jgi:uncharacterized membrane protein YdjX (TVP38/TMEM64 family)
LSEIMQKPAPLSRWIPLALFGSALLGAGLLWRFSPLAAWATPARIDAAITAISASPWWPLTVIGLYIVAGLLAFPLTLLVLTTAVVLGPLGAFCCALIGAISSAVIGYGIGRAVGRKRLIELLGARVERIAHATEQRGILAIAVLRNLPVAPFVVINFAAGALGIQLRTFILGTLAGITPGVSILCLMGDRLRELLANPQPAHIAAAAVVAVAWVSLAIAFQVRFGKRAATQAGGLPQAD